MPESLLKAIESLTVGEIMAAGDPVALLRSACGAPAVRAAAAHAHLDAARAAPLVLICWEGNWYCVVLTSAAAAGVTRWWDNPLARPRILVEALSTPFAGPEADERALCEALLAPDRYGDDLFAFDWDAAHFLRMLLDTIPPQRLPAVEEAIARRSPRLLTQLKYGPFLVHHPWRPDLVDPRLAPAAGRPSSTARRDLG